MVSLITLIKHLGFNFFCFQSVTEKVIYKESDEPGETIVIRSAWIDSQVKGFSKAICAFGYERFKKNCNKMVSNSHLVKFITLQE